MKSDNYVVIGTLENILLIFTWCIFINIDEWMDCQRTIIGSLLVNKRTMKVQFHNIY